MEAVFEAPTIEEATDILRPLIDEMSLGSRAAVVREFRTIVNQSRKIDPTWSPELPSPEVRRNIGLDVALKVGSRILDIWEDASLDSIESLLSASRVDSCRQTLSIGSMANYHRCSVTIAGRSSAPDSSSRKSPGLFMWRVLT